MPPKRIETSKPKTRAQTMVELALENTKVARKRKAEDMRKLALKETEERRRLNSLMVNEWLDSAMSTGDCSPSDGVPETVVISSAHIEPAINETGESSGEMPSVKHKNILLFLETGLNLKMMYRFG
jgi:hypothetical protein